MNEYVCGSNNICRAFIVWGNSVYCTLFSFFYRKRRKKMEKKEKKQNGKILIHQCIFWKEKKKKLERNILRNNQFSNEMKDSRISFVLFFLSAKEKKKNIERSNGENMLSLTPLHRAKENSPDVLIFFGLGNIDDVSR